MEPWGNLTDRSWAVKRCTLCDLFICKQKLYVFSWHLGQEALNLPSDGLVIRLWETAFLSHRIRYVHANLGLMKVQSSNMEKKEWYMKQVKKQQRTLTAEDMKTQNVSHCIFYFFHKSEIFFYDLSKQNSHPYALFADLKMEVLSRGSPESCGKSVATLKSMFSFVRLYCPLQYVQRWIWSASSRVWVEGWFLDGPLPWILPRVTESEALGLMPQILIL